MSRNAAEQYCFFKIPLMISVILCTYSMIEFGPGGFGFLLISSVISWVQLFSNTLSIVGSKLVGLHEPTSSGGLPGFAIIVICATFHWAGKHPALITELHRDVRLTMHFLGISVNILSVIRSYPEAFLGLRSSCIMFWISFGVRNLIGCIICSSSSMALLFLFRRICFVVVRLVWMPFLNVLQKC
jgi:hypothetical protein